MPDGDSWKETFKFFIKELQETYIPMLKETWGLTFPVSKPEPEEVLGEIPEPVPAPSPSIPFYVPPSPEFTSPYSPAAGEPPYDVPEDQAPSPDKTPFPPWDPLLPYGYRAGTPTPEEIVPGPPGFYWYDVPEPWWRNLPLPEYDYSYHHVQAPPVNLERKA